MKKTLSVFAVAVAMALGFTACEDDLGLLGSINLTTSNANGEQAYVDGQTFNFHSAICNVNLSNVHIQYDSLGIDTVVNGSLGAVFVGTTDNLLSAEDFNNITFPLVGINLRDTVVGEYQFRYNVTWSLIEMIDTTNMNRLICDGINYAGMLGNLFVVAASNSSFYLAIGGDINVTNFGRNGETVDASINNMECIYVTREHIQNLMALTPEQRLAINPAVEFPTITFNGGMQSRRASIETVMQALDRMNE